MKNKKTLKMIVMALGVVINIIGAFIAATCKLPVYLDTIGTFFSAFMFGPTGGIFTGIATSLINGLTFDPYSLYFMPVQFIIGFTAGIGYKKGLFKGKNILLGIITVTLTGSIVSSFVSAYVFGGITSSGSSFIVMYLKESGVNIVTSVFSTQVISDLIDKTIAVSLVLAVMKNIPITLKADISDTRRNDGQI